MKPLVSILMTSYNAEKYIQQAIESVLMQTYTHWELLIADDCSTDATRDVIQQFSDPRIRKFHNKKNLHYLRTRNKLAPHAEGEFIALLDADDFYHPEKLENQLLAFVEDPALHLVGTHVFYTNEKGVILDYVDSKPTDHEQIAKRIKTQNVFTGSTIMVRRSSWNELNGYRDFFNTLGYEDYDLTSRLIEKHKSANLKEALYYYRQYPESTSRKNMLYNPFKLNGHLLIQLFIKEREVFGSDSLDRNDIPAIINFVVEKNKPYVDDPSLIYREIMWSFLSRKMFRDAFGYIFQALRVRPFNWKNIRTLGVMTLIFLGILKD